MNRTVIYPQYHVCLKKAECENFTLLFGDDQVKNSSYALGKWTNWNSYDVATVYSYYC